MTIRVRLFAMHRELAGTKSLELEVPDGATIEQAWTALVARYPGMGPGRSAVRFARNGEYADPSTVLEVGDELACIPPVSGGSGDEDPREPGRRRVLRLVEEPFAASLPAELSAAVATPADGAVVVFDGRTRLTPGTPALGEEAEAARHAGRAVEALDYEAHEQMALRILDQIADEIEERFGVERLAIAHRLGRVALGETSILVVAAAPHRDPAFEAARYAIDETKARAPIWKAELFVDGHVWIGSPARTGPGDIEDPATRH